jgi:hypothetical protein
MVTTAQLSLPDLRLESVPMSLLQRHLGLPPCAELDEKLLSLVDQARTTYRHSGEPWSRVRLVAIERISDDTIHLEDERRFVSAFLAGGLQNAKAHAIVAAAISAGTQVDAIIDELWKTNRPDEAMFLNAYSIAIVEHLRWKIGAHLRDRFQMDGLTLLPHYSPGYDGWSLSDQAQLHGLLSRHDNGDVMPIELLPSGGMRPSKSTLLIYGLTRSNDPNHSHQQYWNSLPMTPVSAAEAPSYAFPEKTLALWRDKRLTLRAVSDAELHAKFRMEGSTCNNMGVPLAFDFDVVLRKEERLGYRIVSAVCQPSEGHAGYRSMCAYLDNPDRCMSQLRQHRPLIGCVLKDVLNWTPKVSPAGCLCTRASQDHKWRIALQTIHFAVENS